MSFKSYRIENYDRQKLWLLNLDDSFWLMVEICSSATVLINALHMHVIKYSILFPKYHILKDTQNLFLCQ